MKIFVFIVTFLISLSPLLNQDLNAAEGSFDVFGADTLSRRSTQIYFNQKWVKGTRLVRDNKTVKNQDPEKIIDYRFTFGLNKPIAKGWQVGVFVPFINRRYSVNGLSGKFTNISDITIYVKHKVIENNWEQGAFNLSAILGLDLPTGQHDVTEKGQRLPDSYQLGRGTINSVFGATAGAEWHKFGVTVMALESYRREGAHHYDPGNKTQIGLTMKYRFYQQKYPGAAGNLRWGVVYERTTRSEKYGRVSRDSGGHLWEAKVGWVHHPKPHNDLTFFYHFPIKHSLHGTQRVQEESFHLAMGHRF